jgi:ATP-dependent RNA helicase RhlE
LSIRPHLNKDLARYVKFDNKELTLTTSNLSANECGFDSLELIQPIRKAIAEKKYSQPTPIQSQAIPHLIEGRDLLGCAQTGTGKTGAFALPILQRLAQKRKKVGPKDVAALILTPTRELAAQIGDSFRVYGRYLKIKHTTVYGGVSYRPQIKALSRGIEVLIATPGRLVDLLNQGYLKLDQTETFVLDEGDRMLDMGFLPDIRKIFALLPEERQTMLFSATMSNEVMSLSKQFLNDPIKVSVAPQSKTADNIDQRVMFVDKEYKSELLASVFLDESIKRAVVFTRTKHGANRLAEKLNRGKIKAEALHGDKSQSARLQALRKFRSGNARVLVATDVASRGLDIQGVTHVINYEIPNEAESYVHRIGRTARAGTSGVALSFCDGGERGYLQTIEKSTKSTVTVVEDHPFHSHAVAEMWKTKKPAGKGSGENRRKKRPWSSAPGKSNKPSTGRGRKPGSRFKAPHQRKSNNKRTGAGVSASRSA